MDTRIRKLHDGEYDAILLAEAGLIRLGLDVAARGCDPLREFVPSAKPGRDHDHHHCAEAAFLNNKPHSSKPAWNASLAAAGDRMPGWTAGIDVVSEGVLRSTVEDCVTVRDTIQLDGYEESAAGLARILAERRRSLVDAAKRQLRGVPDRE